MEIRKMAESDLPRVTALSSQLGYPGSIDEMKSRFTQISLNSDTAIFVADENGEVLGWIYMGSVVPLTSKPRAQIWGLVVAESARQRGVGRRLVAEGEKWAKDVLGVSTIGVGSNQDRIESHRFYKKIGYSEKKKWIVYERLIC